MKNPKIIQLLIFLVIIPSNSFAETETNRNFFFGSNMSGSIIYSDNNIIDIITNFNIGYFISKKSALWIGLDLNLNRVKSKESITRKTYADFTFSYSYHTVDILHHVNEMDSISFYTAKGSTSSRVPPGSCCRPLMRFAFTQANPACPAVCISHCFFETFNT